MELSWTGILAVISTSVVIIVSAVPAFKFIAEQIDKRKKEKKEKEQSHLSVSAEIAKIEAERDENEREGLLHLYEIYKSRCEDCERKLEASENNSIVSRTKKREINALLIKIDRNLYLMEKGFEAKYHVLELEAMFNALKKQFVELEDLMP